MVDLLRVKSTAFARPNLAELLNWFRWGSQDGVMWECTAAELFRIIDRWEAANPDAPMARYGIREEMPPSEIGAFWSDYARMLQIVIRYRCVQCKILFPPGPRPLFEVRLPPMGLDDDEGSVGAPWEGELQPRARGSRRIRGCRVCMGDPRPDTDDSCGGYADVGRASYGRRRMEGFLHAPFLCKPGIFGCHVSLDSGRSVCYYPEQEGGSVWI